MNIVNCKLHGPTEDVIKDGHKKDGTQRYACRQCVNRRRKGYEESEEWRNNLRVSRKRYMDFHQESVKIRRKAYKKRSKELLKDDYIKNLITSEHGRGSRKLKQADVPLEMVRLKRVQLLLKRKAKLLEDKND